MKRGLILTFLLILLDQLSKFLAYHYIAPITSVPIIKGVFSLYYLENSGAAFGVLSGQQWFFIVIAFLMLLLSCYVFIHLPQETHYHLMRVICILFAAGAAGNMIDRLIHRYVIDFFYISLINFPVFNIADCYVCIATALTIISIFTIYNKENFDFLRR